MKIIDLSHTIHSKMPVFPGTEPPIFEEANTLEKDGFIEARITMFTHTGTHMDTPAHMIQDGLSLDELPAHHFFGKATIINLIDSESEVICVEDLIKYEKKIRDVDYLILQTGWSRYWGKDQYYFGFPVLSLEAARWLLGFKLKGLGLDAISIDHWESKDFPIHHLLFNKGLVIIENLTNLDAIETDIFTFSCLPLKIEKGDGSPLRAIAMFGE